MARLILIRHGQSLWNAENKFTGWVDSPLSKRGELEAKKAGKYIKENNIIINSSYTSLLTRAISTLKIVLLESNMANIEIIKTLTLLNTLNIDDNKLKVLIKLKTKKL